MTAPIQASLRMRCATERDQGGDDPYGGGEDWQVHLTGVRCTWWSAAGREAVSDERAVVVADEHLLLGRGEDVAEGDRIVSIVDDQGREILDRKRRVEYVAVQRSHLDASLRAVGNG